jgi:KaiC/GvpD/RAD55 family RecA-like ATPase
MHVQKLPTGIEGFDDICHGGLPNARSTLVSGTSGTGKTVFSLQYLHHGICNFDEPGIFVTFAATAAMIPKMTITMINSINVKPLRDLVCFMIFPFLII